jgi:hypothetical protein
VRRRKDGKIVRITLSNVSDDSSLVVHRGNPRRYSHDHENEVNPPRVWAMRHISSQVRDIFRASVLDNFVDKSTAPPIGQARNQTSACGADTASEGRDSDEKGSMKTQTKNEKALQARVDELELANKQLSAANLAASDEWLMHQKQMADLSEYAYRKARSANELRKEVNNLAGTVQVSAEGMRIEHAELVARAARLAMRIQGLGFQV